MTTNRFSSLAQKRRHDALQAQSLDVIVAGRMVGRIRLVHLDQFEATLRRWRVPSFSFRVSGIPGFQVTAIGDQPSARHNVGGA